MVHTGLQPVLAKYQFSPTNVLHRLTHYQTTNFSLSKLKVCRRQFQIWRKWQQVIRKGRKHCGKRRNCSLRAISPFPSVFKTPVSQGRQKVSLWEWVNHALYDVSCHRLVLGDNWSHVSRIESYPLHLVWNLSQRNSDLKVGTLLINCPVYSPNLSKYLSNIKEYKRVVHINTKSAKWGPQNHFFASQKKKNNQLSYFYFPLAWNVWNGNGVAHIDHTENTHRTHLWINLHSETFSVMNTFHNPRLTVNMRAAMFVWFLFLF